MTTTQEIRQAMKSIDKYCEENNLEGHQFLREVVWNSLNGYSDLKDRNTDNFIVQHLQGMKIWLWT